MIHDNQKELVITKESLEELQEKYDNAVKEDLETFMFQNTVLYTGYAKYLLEYCNLRKGQL